MIKEAIQTLVSGRSLTMEEAASVMEEIMENKVTPAQFGAFVTVLRVKGETAGEITGFARTMRAKAIRVMTTHPVVDVVGTGGDKSNTFNISTTAAFVAAGAGLKVAKHGNRAASSQCGSADVLEALGVRIDLNAKQVERCLEKVGICFMFAPTFHPAMRCAAAPRREIGIPTVFNILGPLTNPAGAKAQVLGVANGSLVEKLALVLQSLGCCHALVVHGEDGLDEITITGKTQICELKDGCTRSYSIGPEDFGFEKASMTEVKGGTPDENAEMLRRILNGERGAKRDVVVMNTAAALVAGNRASDFREGAHIAEKVIDNGQAQAKLEELINFSRNIEVG